MRSVVFWKLLAVFGVCCAIVAVPLIFYILHMGQPKPSDAPEHWGQFGDYIGGTLNPVFAILNLLALIYLSFEIHHRDVEREEEARGAERRNRAVEHLTQFMTSEYYLKSRLTIQEYLLPTGSKFRLSTHLNDDGSYRLLDFTELTTALARKNNECDNEARYLIRAIPSFFWLIDRARDSGYIAKNERIFNFHYAWYWVYIIQFRLRSCKDYRLFQRFDWMLTTPEFDEVKREYRQYLAGLTDSERTHWESASNAAKVYLEEVEPSASADAAADGSR